MEKLPAFIDMGYDPQWLMTDEQVEYFFKHAETPILSDEALEEVFKITGYDHVWTRTVKNLTLIENHDGFSVVKNASVNFKEGERTHLHMFPQYQGLSKYFKRIITLDLSYIEDEVLLHQDAYAPNMDHGFCLKIFPYGSIEDFTMVKLNKPGDPDYSRQKPLTKGSNIFLIDNMAHGHFTPPNPKPFIVLFINGELQDSFLSANLDNLGTAHYL